MFRVLGSTVLYYSLGFITHMNPTDLIVRRPVGDYVRLVMVIISEVNREALRRQNAGWTSHSIQNSICSINEK